jgi:hypothetical protein
MTIPPPGGTKKLQYLIKKLKSKSNRDVRFKIFDLRFLIYLVLVI